MKLNLTKARAPAGILAFLTADDTANEGHSAAVQDMASGLAHAENAVFPKLARLPLLAESAFPMPVSQGSHGLTEHEDLDTLAWYLIKRGLL